MSMWPFSKKKSYSVRDMLAFAEWAKWDGHSPVQHSDLLKWEEKKGYFNRIRRGKINNDKVQDKLDTMRSV